MVLDEVLYIYFYFFCLVWFGVFYDLRFFFLLMGCPPISICNFNVW